MEEVNFKKKLSVAELNQVQFQKLELCRGLFRLDFAKKTAKCLSLIVWVTEAVFVDTNENRKEKQTVCTVCTNLHH